MDTNPVFGCTEHLAHVIGDMAKSVSVRNGENQQQRLARFQAATQTILDFLPRDSIEAMVAGHCVMMHEVVADSVRLTLSGEVDATRRATRANIVAMDKAFANNLTRMEHYQKRASEGQSDTPAARPATVAEQAPIEVPEAARTEEDVAQADPPLPPMAEVPTSPAGQDEAASPPEVNQAYKPSPEAIAACLANPAALAALEAGDAEGFARAMGIGQPSGDFLAAAAEPGSVFDRREQAVRSPGELVDA